MTVNEVLKGVSALLNENALYNYLSSGAVEENQTAQSLAASAELLLNCYNMTVSEVCEERYRLKCTERVESQNNCFYYSNFLHTPQEILSCEFSGNKINYKVKPQYIEAAANELDVTYSYLPEASALTDNFIFENTKLTDRLISYGVAAEYLLIKGLYEEAVVFRNRFEEGLKAVIPPKSCKKIKQRNWF